MIKDLYDTSGKVCCICFDDFNNGDKALVLDCGNNHLFCEECQKQWSVIYPGGDVVEPEDNMEIDWAATCPVCRCPSDVIGVFNAQNYYPGSGLNKENPIRID